MWKGFFSVALALALALGGCQQGAQIAAAVPATEAAIIAETKTLCGFEPLAEDVLNVLNDFAPGVDSVDSVASALCGAILGTKTAEASAGVGTGPGAFVAFAKSRSAYFVFHGHRYRVRFK